VLIDVVESKTIKTGRGASHVVPAGCFMTIPFKLRNSSPRRRKGRRDVFSNSLPLLLQNYRRTGRTAKNKKSNFWGNNFSFPHITNIVGLATRFTL
jgi:hypothetical protein